MTFLSRISGLVRDQIYAQVFGASAAMDAFVIAFRIPNFMRRLSAEGSFSMAFVPVLAEYKAKGDQAAVKALVDRADRCPRSRLPQPVTAALDEIANVVRWPRLPSYYSTFGSRGIICDTVLQSYAQGVELWGAEGMKKIFDSAGIVVVGPGHKNNQFLNDLATLIGTHTEQQRSYSNGSGERSHSTSIQTVEKQTMTAAELAALPRGRMLILATGRRPMLARMVRWQEQDLPTARKEVA